MIPFLRHRGQTSGRRRRRTDGRRLVLLGGFYLGLLAVMAVLIVTFIRPRDIRVPAARAAVAGVTVLTVESRGQRTRFDMRALEALPQRTYFV